LFGNIGFPEMIVIFVVALLVIGPQRLPEVARSLGRTLRELKRATSDLQNSFDLEEEFETVPKAGPSAEETKLGGAEAGGPETPSEPGKETQAAETDQAPKADGADGGAAPAVTDPPPDGGSRPT